jgi:phosphoglycolate phosphatase
MYDAIIWDWNGTLLDDVEVSLEIVNEILGDHSLSPLTAERYRQIFEIPARVYWERAGLDLTKVSFSTISARFCAAFEERLERIPLHPGAEQILESLRASGVRQFLLSSTEHESLQRMVGRYGIREYFEVIQGMHDTLARGKLEAVQDLADRVGLERSAVLMVGDTSHDADLAGRLGLECVLLAAGHQSSSRLASSGRHVVETFEGLRGFIESSISQAGAPR